MNELGGLPDNERKHTVDTAFAMVRQVQRERKERETELADERVVAMETAHIDREQKTARKSKQLAKVADIVPWTNANDLDSALGYTPGDAGSYSTLKETERRKLLIQQMQYLTRVKGVKRKELAQTNPNTHQKYDADDLRVLFKRFMRDHSELFAGMAISTPTSAPVQQKQGQKRKAQVESNASTTAKTDTTINSTRPIASTPAPSVPQQETLFLDHQLDCRLRRGSLGFD